MSLRLFVSNACLFDRSTILDHEGIYTFIGRMNSCRLDCFADMLKEDPLSALFFYAFLPQFVDPARGAVTGQILVFGVLFVLLAFCTDSLYALLGSAVGKLLTRNVRFRQGQRYVTGGVYIVLGVSAAVTGSGKK